MLQRVFVLMVFFVLMLPGFGFSQPDRTEEISRLMLDLESASQVQRVDAAKIISRSGLQDQALYEKIAALLKTGYAEPYDKDQIDEMSWLCKALAASGDSQYRQLLDQIAATAPSSKLQRYAKQSAELIETYAQRSRIMNATEGWDAELSAEENRVVGMLKSNDIGLKRDAAKIIYRNKNNKEKVYDAAAASLLDMLQNFHSDSSYVDTMAWLCKALATSGDVKYVDVLEQVHSDTQSVKLSSHASKALSALRR
jgi:hypothetical protein